MRESVVGRALILKVQQRAVYIHTLCIGFGFRLVGLGGMQLCSCVGSQSNYIESVRDRVADRLIGVL